MVRMLATVAFVLGAAGLVVADDEATKKAMKQLEGKYKPKALFKGGKAAPPEMIDEVEVVVIKDGTITLKKKNGTDDPVKFTVDVAEKPAHIDVTPNKGPRQGQKMKGIYKLEKGVLTIVLAQEGDRPKDFKGEGDEEMKMVFERKKDE